ncbi:centromere protein P isoform X2 [Engystomops pustulosus]
MPKMEENLIERCEDAITSLKQELEELQEQYKENQREIVFLSSTNINQGLESFYGKNISDDPNMRTIQTNLVHREQEIRFFNTVNGIELTKYLKKTESKSEEGTIFNHKLVGCCHFLSFELEFKTLEEKTKRCEVIHLKIFMDCDWNSDLKELVSRAQKSLNLLGFFRTLSAFTEWCEYRKSTFSQFKDTYPLAVGLPLGSTADYMVLMNPDLPGCELILVWKIEINEDGSVTPVLDLLPKIPEQAITLDKTGLVEKAGISFKTLLKTFGLQATIENIIHSFCLKKSNE